MGIKHHATASRDWSLVVPFWNKSRASKPGEAHTVHALKLRTGDAIKRLRMGDAKGGLDELDCVYADWKLLDNKKWMAKIRFVLMEHYLLSGQPQIAWEILTSNAGLFDRTGLASSRAVAAVAHEASLQLGKARETPLLGNWLAMVEDIELEYDPERRSANTEWFEDHRLAVGGLAGLLGLKVPA